MSFKRIMVPLDFSSHSSLALKLAADLSRRYEARLTLMHVFQPFAVALPESYVLYSANQIGEMLTMFGKQLDAAKIEAEAAGAIAVNTEQVQGSPDTEIVNFARAEKFDLIVMGTHGRTGLQHAIIGSVAERVVRRAPCPVLTVRHPDAKK